MKQRQPSKFALFVKEQYSVVKRCNKNKPHVDIMKILSQQYKTVHQ